MNCPEELTLESYGQSVEDLFMVYLQKEKLCKSVVVNDGKSSCVRQAGLSLGPVH